MSPNRRLTIVAALLVLEFAIVGAMFAALGRGGHPTAGGHWGRMRPFPNAARGSADDSNGHVARTYETGPAPHVFIADGSAQVTVTARAGSTSVDVDEETFRSGHVDDSSHLNVERTGDGVRIERQGSVQRMFFFGSLRRVLAVSVPPAARVEIASAGTTHVTGLRQTLSFRSRNGALIVSDQRGNVTAATSNGRIELHDVTAPALGLTSRNGRIELDRVRSASVDVQTSNGRIETVAAAFGGGSIRTRNGRIEIVLARDSDVTVTARSGRGQVRVASATGSGSAGDGGDARTLRVGNGTGRLDVAAANGPISISIEGA